MDHPRDSAAETTSSELRFKVCGVTTAHDARVVCALGADWIGVNFHPASPRVVKYEIAKQIISAVPHGVTAVGVFVNRSVDEIASVGRELGLSAVQLHGDEPPEDVERLARVFRVVRAFRLRDEAS